VREAVWADLYQPPVCEVCGHEGEVGRRPIMWNGWTCEFCFRAWYGYGGTNAEKCKAISLDLRSKADGEVKP
jgi:ribosomal protein L37AE/L43A